MRVNLINTAEHCLLKIPVTMTSPASLNVEPPALDLPPAFDPQPAEGLEEIEILPFEVTKFRKAITERLRAIDDGEDVQQWMVFSDFDSSKLKYIDQRRYPIRVQVDGNTLVIKIVHPVHEAMHRGLLAKSAKGSAETVA